MRYEDIFSHTFIATGRRLGLGLQWQIGAMERRCRSVDSAFCREVVARGLLTSGQMQRAARRYRLGRSLSGKTVFWMINRQGIVLDGRLGGRWVSELLRQREPELRRDAVSHCLFGEHLAGGVIAVVPSAETAVIYSELFPQYAWLAAMSPANLTPDKFSALRGRRVLLFPMADPLSTHSLAWLRLAEDARRLYRLDVHVVNFQ